MLAYVNEWRQKMLAVKASVNLYLELAGVVLRC